jgi:hypothetical protein
MSTKSYSCPRCGYSTNIRASFKSHLARKRRCKPQLSDVPLTLLQESFKIFINPDMNDPMDYQITIPIDKTIKGFLYMIREREFIRTNENIYKVGKTTQEIHKRLCKYPKKSELILVMKFDNCHKAEKDLLKLARSEFKQRRDIGIEYFEADEKSLMKLFSQIS